MNIGFQILETGGQGDDVPTGVILTLSFYYHHRDMIKQAERAGVRMEARRVETRAKRVA